MAAPMGNNNPEKGRRWRMILERAAMRDNCKRLEAAAEKLLELAADGDIAAIKEVGDRLDGKPAQSVTLAGDQENPIKLSGTVEFVHARPPAPES